MPKIKKTPTRVGNINVFDHRKKREQLRSNGKYPFRYAVDHLRFSVTPHLTSKQAWDMLHAVARQFIKTPGGNYHRWNDDLVKELAEMRIENIIRKMIFINERD